MDLVVPCDDSVLTAATLRECICKSRDPTVALLDLTWATFVDPAGLVAVAAIAERAHLDGISVEFRQPLDTDCLNYLSRMHLAQALDEVGVEHELMPVSENHRGDRLHELRRFRSEEGVEEVTETIMRLLTASHGAGSAPDVCGSLFEIAVNAVDHSGEEGGFVALQTFPRRHDVAFAIADSGKGLRASLNENRANVGIVRNDSLAIEQAAQKHVSGISRPGRGRGISNVIAAATDGFDGQVLLVSGNAAGIFDSRSLRPRVSLLHDSFLGTLVQARLSM